MLELCQRFDHYELLAEQRKAAAREAERMLAEVEAEIAYLKAKGESDG